MLPVLFDSIKELGFGSFCLKFRLLTDEGHARCLLYKFLHEMLCLYPVYPQKIVLVFGSKYLPMVYCI